MLQRLEDVNAIAMLREGKRCYNAFNPVVIKRLMAKGLVTWDHMTVSLPVCNRRVMITKRVK